MDALGYHFVWLKPKINPALGVTPMKVFTVEEARALREALREALTREDQMGRFETNPLISDVKRVMEQLQPDIRATLKKSLLSGLNEFLNVASVFCVIGFDPALTR